ncbi:DoxX family protein [Paenibacillus methanolicus]|uniref:DoxX-like protein n=1 Tax=Paenibacillus methanolicus TaxID=582686 RepID=A0A5S5C7M7_9BACL|nr:DoxX family protein [Paenibacillus methanolicus]TYP74608.1 DoxX-like protein [Paenibacillus methanolicus]
MKSTKIAYWIITACTLIGFALSAYNELAQTPKTFTQTTELLGYPAYFLTLLGVAKIIGIGVLLVPKYYRLKEWAYAGLTIDCISAFWSQIAVGNPMGSIQAVVVLFFVLLSYYLLRRMERGAALNRGIGLAASPAEQRVV